MDKTGYALSGILFALLGLTIAIIYVALVKAS